MINLNNCDKEPIHLLGKLQRNGHLIAVEVDSLKVAFVSEGLDESLNMSVEEIFKMDIGNTFGPWFLDEVKKYATTSKNYQIVKDLIIKGNSFFKAILSKSNGYLLIELEDVTNLQKYNAYANEGLSFIDEASQVFENINDETKLAINAASLLRTYTGYDRVMVYKFNDNGDGKVIAEDKKFGLEPFLGLHYPASDIPKQARLLYLKNKVRAIYDVEDEGKDIFSLDGSHAEERLDLSYSVFRSVSPIHLQYLNNMGVKSTHGVSLIINKKLWGMLLCHDHTKSKFLSIEQRLTTQFFGDLMSNRIALINSNKKNEEFEKLNTIVNSLKFTTHDDLGVAIQTHWQEIGDLIKCDGYFLQSPLGTYQSGEQISEKQIEVLDSAMEYNQDLVYTSNSLSNEGMNNTEGLFPYSGFLRLTISEENKEFVYLFRKEKKKKINWAGNPNKPVLVEENGQEGLTPRKSFSKWEQLVEGQSEDWSAQDVEYANILRDAFITFEIEHLKQVYSTGTEVEEATEHYRNLLFERNKELNRLNSLLKKELEEKTKSQNNLRIAKEAAEQMNKMQTEFPSTLSHEMRTPLNGIMGLSLMIQEKSVSPELKEFASMQIETTKRMTKTLNRVLELAKIQSDGTKPILDAFDLNNFLNETVKPLKETASKKRQKLLLINHEEEMHIISDQILLEQIISNLITNAIKFTPEKGVIQLNIKLVSKNLKEILEIAVEDNGIGIWEENLERIFEPFFKEGEITKHSDNSSGLGLFLVKKYSEYLNGKIRVESEKGVGSMFLVQIPVVKA
ncbi:GAF domain-containing protein [Litoribacter ruber]|uniref:ATP-binding protein n=1 Tax=Litoribacter ruber TaxID=702568 RepID=UPI001BD967BD|nr:ATP-binding protein [Litoribacter ruber]MBT0812490.1 GAF domain-containing protein [Litoribacter ruber]